MTWLRSARTPSDTPSRRRARGHLATALAAAAALALAACSATADATGSTPNASGGLTPLVVGAPWNGGPGTTPTETGPFGYAVARGLADKILATHGYVYEKFVGFSNGPPVVEALLSGDVTVGFIGDTPATQARASDRPVTALAIARPSSDIWFLTRDASITSVAGLAGKKVALQFGSNFDKYGRAVLERAAVLEDVELVNLLFADALPALQRGDVDAVPLPATTAGLWLARNDFHVLSRASVDDPDLLATSVTLTSEATATAQPELADAVWEVYRAGADAIEADHDAYATWVSETTGTPVDVVLQANLWAYGTERVDPQGLATVRTTLEFLTGNGSGAKEFDVDGWVAP